MHNVCLHCLMKKEHWLIVSDLISNSKASKWFWKETLTLMCMVDEQVTALEIIVTNSEQLMLFLKNIVFIQCDQFKLRAGLH